MSEQQPTAKAPAGARKARIILALIVIVGLAVVARMWWRGTYFEETDNAYVEGYISAIAPRVDAEGGSGVEHEKSPVYGNQLETGQAGRQDRRILPHCNTGVYPRNAHSAPPGQGGGPRARRSGFRGTRAPAG